VASKLPTFLRELKRRKVYHVAVVYVVVGFAVAQGAEYLFQLLEFPLAAAQFVAILILIGFPIALILAWAYELKPEAEAQELVEGSSRPGTTSPSAEENCIFPLDRVAVLPFASIHPDREHDYFADGITEELISAISRIQGLDVIARTSVIRYQDSELGVRAIGEELRVGAVLEGSVRKAGDQLRVTVQLINAESEGHLWAEDYDREFKEIFSVQKDIATHVAEALKLRLLTPDANGIGEAPTEDLAAYDLYLLGRHHLNGRREDGIRKAMSCFEQAAEIDPDFAAAYAGLADAYLLAGIGYVTDPPENAIGRAQEMARKGLGLQSALPEAHTSLGYAALLKWDVLTAETHLREAIRLNPSHAQAHQWLGQLLSAWAAKYEEGTREYQRALELDPLSAIITTELGWVYQYQCFFERAVEQYDQALDLDPDLAIAHFNRGDALQKMGRLEDALESYDRALEISPGMPWARAFRGSAHAESGRTDLAEAALNELKEEEGAGHPIATFLAVLEDALGREEDALASLHRAVRNREPMVHGLSATEGFLTYPSLRGTPEFQELLGEIDQILAGKSPT
jgi:TolB-like protein/Tfp pilus assembly protein PilF